MTRIGLTVLIFLTLTGHPAFAVIGGFSVDVEAAMAKAEAENKDVLLSFNGSDWCGWCIKLIDEVFGKPDFQLEVKKHFVLVELDFPNDDSQLDRKTILQNAKWHDKLSVEGFPSVFLLDAKGRPYAKTGYESGGPQQYLQHLSKLREIREQRDELFLLAEGVAGGERAKYLDLGLRTVGMEFAMVGYADLVDEIVTLDADDVLGLKSQWQEPKMRGVYRKILPEIFQAASEQGPQAALRQLDEAEKKYPPIGALTQQLLAVRCHFMGESGQLVEAIQLFDTEIENVENNQDKLHLHLMKARLLADNERTEEAAVAIDAAIDLAENPNVKRNIERLKKTMLQ